MSKGQLTLGITLGETAMSNTVGHTIFFILIKRLIMLIVVLLFLSLQAGCALTSPSTGAVVKEATYGSLPLLFIPNHGQFDSRVAYAVQGRDISIFFSDQGVTFVLTEQPSVSREKVHSLRQVGPPEPEAQVPRHRWALKVDFVDANPAVRPETLEQAGTLISYFKGRPEEWRTGLQAGRRIIYRDLWPGIDLIYSGTIDRLKYDFIVHPGADPDRIRLAYRGTDSVQVTPEGGLVATTPIGTLQDEVPVAWQEREGGRDKVTVAYGLHGPAGVQVASLATDGSVAGVNPNERVQIVGFNVGDYDRTRTLILDPEMLVYCGFIGGSHYDYGYDIAVDRSGNAYVTGFTESTDGSFPVTVGPDLSHSGYRDAFVAKVKADGSGLEYCGFIGGTGSTIGWGIAVDDNGNAYVTGKTSLTDGSFPTTVGPDLSYNGLGDAFVAKVKADGSGLEYCGFIGGTESDSGSDVAIDSSGNAYITGSTYTSDGSFPVGGTGLATNHSGEHDAFIAKVKADGSGLAYCGFVGGTDRDYGGGIDVDNDGNAYITGYTYSTDGSFPATVGPDLSHNGGMHDAFVAKVKADGSGLEYCGFIGGTGRDFSFDIAIDSNRNAYIVGHTGTSDGSFPVGGIELAKNHSGEFDAFIAKVKADGSGLVYCGFIGGTGYEYGSDIAVDSVGNAYVTGDTESTDGSFPVTVGPDLSHSGYRDAFVAKVKADGSGLEYCGFIGGTGSTIGGGIAVDDNGNAYVTGNTSSTDGSFPTTVGPDLSYNGGGNDAFVAKITMQQEAPPTLETDDFPWPIFLPAILEGRKKE